MEVFLISEKTLKTNHINDNVSSEYIRPAIQTAQEIGLQSIIGTNLYKKLIDKVENDDVSGYYKELLDDYITPYLTYKVLSDIQIPLAFKNRNAGVVQTNNEYMNNTYMKDVQTIMDFYDQKASFYAIRMSDWLCANSSNIPEYNITNNGDLPKDRDGYNTNIYLE